MKAVPSVGSLASYRPPKETCGHEWQRRGAVTVFEYGNESKQLRSAAVSCMKCGERQVAAEAVEVPSVAQPDWLFLMKPPN